MPKGFSLTVLSKNSDIVLAIGVVAILIVMILPIPAALIDVLLALNVGLALLILFVSMYITKPLEFSVFPGLLLIVTIFRLSLNVATTRLILGDGYGGKMIEAFGNFVVKGNYIVGFIIFLILVIINFVVITKGAGRVAEVAARFTLDAMPGKQMAIDADLNSGIIDEIEARARRIEIANEADFYGAMDGSSKFVRGDAIAGLIITVLNIVGGFIVGVAQLHLTFSEALATFTRLTVGDGLVSQIPSLIIATASGMIVTRSASDASLGSDITRQLFHNSRVAYIAGGVLLLLAITPGLPFFPFTFLAAGLGVVGFVVDAKKNEKKEEQLEKSEKEEPEEDIKTYLHVDPLELEIGYNLIPLVDVNQHGNLLSRITQIRKQCAIDLGIIIPPVRIRDNMQLQPNEYIILVKGKEVAKSSLMVGRYLALDPGTASGELDGAKIKEPAFGLPAVWIKGDQKEKSELMGYTVVTPSAVLATHISEMLKSHADKIITRQDVHDLVENLKKDQPKLIEEIIPHMMTTGDLEKILKNLLAERVSVRDLGTILECVSDHIKDEKDLDILTEFIRQKMGHSISAQYQNPEGEIHTLTLATELESLLSEAIEQSKRNGIRPGQALAFTLNTQVLQKLFAAISAQIDLLEKLGKQPMLITAPSIRVYLRKLLEPIFKNFVILSYAEIASDVDLHSLGMLRVTDEG